MSKPLVKLLAYGLAAGAFLVVVGTRATGLPPLGTLLDPWDGLYRTARIAAHPDRRVREIPALQGPVTVLRDARGVPHIFAGSDRDAIVAFGFVTAQDRLFQLDFIPRVAAGRLSSAMGEATVGADRFLRATGMDWGARRNLERIRAEGGREWDMLTWYSTGVNAYLDGLDEAALPLEFRLLGYRPDPWTPLQSIRMLQYMVYDLTFRSDDAAYAVLRERLSPEDYALLFPDEAPLHVPIVPERGGLSPTDRPVLSRVVESGASTAAAHLVAGQRRLAGGVAEGFVQGKGSNNWAVAGTRSTTGAPILAGDMHLGLTLPAVWYEVHLVTPTMNTYGVAVPGAPLPVEAFNDHVAWAFTNTGSDQIDHLALQLDASGTRYRFEGAWRRLEAVADTIGVKGRHAVIDTLYYSHWGPVVRDEGEAVALRWVAHDASRTLHALWGMNHADGYDAFQQALRYWDTPMQNILYADVDGNVAIRSTGYMPLRRSGSGAGLRDGGSAEAEWVGRIPFEELPHSVNPPQGFLTSTNQQPVDGGYPYYLGHDWRNVYRSVRIDTLLRGRARHSVDDLKRYQSDVVAVQHQLFTPLLDTLAGLSARADTLRRLLGAWDGTTAVDRAEPLVLDVFLRNLTAFAWDEPALRAEEDAVPRPSEAVLYRLLTERPRSRWLDVAGTAEREDARGLLRAALEATADTLARRHGWNPAAWRWGDHHAIVFRHLTGSEALRPLWRGPVAFPGFEATLSPAGRRTTTHSASWRVVVDLSTSPPRGYGVYPGGQSGNPFSAYYDLQLEAYVNFEHYALLKPATVDAFPQDQLRARLTLKP